MTTWPSKKVITAFMVAVTTLSGVIVQNLKTASDVQVTVGQLAQSDSIIQKEIRSLATSDSIIRADLGYLKEKAMSDSIRTVVEEEFEKRYRIQVAKTNRKQEVTYAENQE